MHPGFISRRLIALVFALSLIVSSGSCSAVADVVGQVREQIPDSGQPAERSPRPTGDINTGPVSIVGSGVVEPSGVVVTVQDPAGPLDGLELSVPAGAYTNAHQVSVSYAPVLGHTFGEHFNPITHLLSVENGGRYADELMTMRIPVDIPADHFAMAFYYDATTGTLEGVPVAGIAKDSITIVTRHFSSLVVSIIRNNVLDELLKKGIDSGFRPGADDWQFTNRGSYIVPNGHCAGQSVSAMWYYCERPDGNDPFLWNLYDNNGDDPSTPDLWEDDSYGYRFASTTQLDIRWGKFEVDFLRALRGQHDEAHFKAFAYAIMLTGEPQYVGISSSAGGGHAMIAYRVDSKGIAIADPNYPGHSGRRIDYADGAFTPYNSGANADEIAEGNGRAYESIGYMAKTAIVDWSLLSSRWEEFKDGAIGNDRFPAYQVLVVDDEGNEKPLVDGYVSKSSKVHLKVTAGIVPVAIRVWLNGDIVRPDNEKKYPLEDGANLIGIEIWGDVNADPQNRSYKYIDFKYFNITYGELQCNGWVLDSVEVERYETYEFHDSRFDHTFSASEDGWFSGSGNIKSPLPDGDPSAAFSVSGSWTPLPDCINPGEPVQIELVLNSSLETSDKERWGSVGAYLYLVNGRELEIAGAINQTLYATDPPLNESTVAKFTFDADSHGEYPQWIPVRVECSTDSGVAVFVYNYVWRG